VRRIAADPRIATWVAGRNHARAEAFCTTLDRAHPLALDVARDDWAQALDRVRPDLLIHAAGPFQGQDYRIAEAAIDRGIHYLDLADSRAFVSGFPALDARAREHGVLAVSGASTAPGLSAAAIDHLRPAFARIEAIDCGISPGNRTERGRATVAAIASQVGRPVPRWRDGRWQHAFGWQDLRRHHFPEPVGGRWLSACDVPDMSLFPARYGARDVRFGAGLELSILHLGLWGLSWLARTRLVADWSRHVAALHRIGDGFRDVGSDAGAMFVRVCGIDHGEAPLARAWTIVAGSGDGPEIPCTAAVLLARRFAAGTLDARGARACLDLFTLEEFLAELADHDIRCTIT
jgi:hypothetical protein